MRRLAPTLVAAALAVLYVIVAPTSLDLAAHLLRAKLFADQGFGVWNNWWYAGHDTPGYSVLFPPLAALLTPQLVGAISAVATAAVFERLVRDRFGDAGTLGAIWFGLATAVDLYTGRLTFAFGLLPAVACARALQRRRDGLAAVLAVLTALASPVAALFAAVAAIAAAAARSRDSRPAALAAVATAVAALLPVLILAALFPEGGSEPFTRATLLPIPFLCLGALAVTKRRDIALRAGIALYLAGCLAAYLIATPVGSNAARLGPLLGGPFAALLLWPRHRRLFLFLALPLLYLQWQAPIRDVHGSWGDPSTSSVYYRPLLTFLDRQPGAPFRIEIPFTKYHWEAYEVAPAFPLARGWERQLDILDNAIFYRKSALDARSYRAWLDRLAVHYVAVADAGEDYSARAETALIDHGLPYLRLVARLPHWRVFAVAHPTPLANPPARVTSLSSDGVRLRFSRPGSALVRVRFSPYWALGRVPGCVSKTGDFTRVTARRAGTAELVIRFALARILTTAPRCG